MDLKKNDIIEISITDISEDGLGIGRYFGFALFVKDALPKDRVRAVITKINSSYGFARALEILESSPERVAPPCPLAKKCGGCQLMELAYSQQLKLKEERVANALLRIGEAEMNAVGFEPICAMVPEDFYGTFVSPEAVPLRHSENTLFRQKTSGAPLFAENAEFCPLHYRNKVQLPAGENRNKEPVFGFYAGRTHHIIETSSCPAAFDGADKILEAVRKFTQENNISVYNEKTNTGLLRHVLMRKGFRTGQIMVCLVINAAGLYAKKGSADGACQRQKNTAAKAGESRKLNEKLIQALTGTGLNITSLCLNINRRSTNVIMGDETFSIYGKDYIEDKIFGLTFKISAQSFFQVNSIQAEKLYAKALEYASLTGAETVWDLYCGTGTISLFLAQKAKKVYGVEIVPAAIENARDNAALNNIENAEFFCGRSEEVFPEFYRNEKSRPDVVVLDPPRKGCGRALLDAILTVMPRRIVYISCNPATLARDTGILSEKYSLKKVMPCDMFPHTCHCEAAALLTAEKEET